MAVEVTARNLQRVALRGFERGRLYRRARAMFVKEFVGQYYQNVRGLSGDEPINLIFHTIRSIVPSLVMKNPVNELVTTYTPQRQYGELLGLGIDQVEREMRLKETLRAWVVSAFFGWGIVKTGIAASGEMLVAGDTRIDPGQVYAKLVDLDDFIIDPVCTDINETTIKGSRIRISRQVLLDTDGYDHDLVRSLPISKYSLSDGNRIEEISKRNTAVMEMHTLQDYVDVVELWVPEADALVTISDPTQITLDNYLRVTDYYGPKEGPYVELSFTPPVPNNPYPIAPVGIWHDLHRMANRMFKKIMSQADNQKDILGYSPATADEAQDILDADDGDAVAMTDPNAAKMYSFGGQNRNNEVMLRELQMWYNYISGNPDQMAGNMTKGTKGSKETATRSSIIQANSAVGMEDARSILYDRTADISRNIGWFLHTDPLIKMPITKRVSGGRQIQLWLTPEQRSGDFLKFTFRIIARSMSRLDPNIKSKRIMEFATNLVPNLMNSAMVAMQMGLQFNVQRAITDLAKEMDILEDVQDWFDDPEFEQKMAMFMNLGPQNAGKAGMGSPEATLQNQGGAMTRPIMSPDQEMNRQSQEGAAESQSANFGAY